MVKATIADGDQLRYSANWAIARRSILKVYDDHLECGDWQIQYADIQSAVLTSIRSSLFIPGYVLRVDIEGASYHFGLNWANFWKTSLPFDVIREKGKLGYSAFSIFVRIILFAYLVYWVSNNFL